MHPARITADKPYFFYDPLECDWACFATEAERDAAVSVLIKEHYLEDGYWMDEVDQVVVGKITGRAQEHGVITPEGKIDEDGMDEGGTYWDSDAKEVWRMCDYKVKPLPQPKEAQND